MLPPQQARDDSLRARLAQGRDAVTRASEFRACCGGSITRSEEHTSELQSDQISYAVFCLKKKKTLARTDIPHGTPAGRIPHPLARRTPPCPRRPRWRRSSDAPVSGPAPGTATSETAAIARR